MTTALSTLISMASAVVDTVRVWYEQPLTAIAVPTAAKTETTFILFSRQKRAALVGKRLTTTGWPPRMKQTSKYGLVSAGTLIVCGLTLALSGAPLLRVCCKALLGSAHADSPKCRTR